MSALLRELGQIGVPQCARCGAQAVPNLRSTLTPISSSSKCRHHSPPAHTMTASLGSGYMRCRHAVDQHACGLDGTRTSASSSTWIGPGLRTAASKRWRVCGPGAVERRARDGTAVTLLVPKRRARAMAVSKCAVATADDDDVFPSVLRRARRDGRRLWANLRQARRACGANHGDRWRARRRTGRGDARRTWRSRKQT